MDKRISLRTIIENAVVNGQTTSAESFQNVTLRPVIKMQHPLLLAFVSDHVLKVNKGFMELSIEQKRLSLVQLFQKDVTLKQRIIGMMMGQFTLEEFSMYTTIESDINKRIISICLERMIDHVNEIGK